MTQQEKDKIVSEIHAQIGKLKQDLSLLKDKLRQVKVSPVDKTAEPTKQ